jgi:hypothetical protein
MFPQFQAAFVLGPSKDETGRARVTGWTNPFRHCERSVAIQCLASAEWIASLRSQ